MKNTFIRIIIIDKVYMKNTFIIIIIETVYIKNTFIRIIIETLYIKNTLNTYFSDVSVFSILHLS